MTPSSPLSRLEKLAEEHFKKVNPSLDPEYYLKPGNSMTVDAFIAGGKAILQIISEPGEACGPRFKVNGYGFIPWHVAEKAYEIYVKHHGGWGQSLERVNERGGFYVEEMDKFYPDWRKESSENDSLRSELLQARAAHMRVQSQFDEARRLMEGHMETMKNAEAALASSEARVRILAGALEEMVAPLPLDKNPKMTVSEAFDVFARRIGIGKQALTKIASVLGTEGGA